jgi:hypothetical protein
MTINSMLPCSILECLGIGRNYGMAGFCRLGGRCMHVKGVLVLCKETACANELARYS